MEHQMKIAKSLVANTKKITAIEKVLCEIIKLETASMDIGFLVKEIPKNISMSESNFRKCMHHLYRMNIIKKIPGAFTVCINPLMYRKA